MVNKYFVYIVKCADGTYYTGKTTDLTRRLKEHNGELKNGAKYTRGRRPVELVYYEDYSSSSEAGARECEIKGMTRPEKKGLVYGHIFHG